MSTARKLPVGKPLSAGAALGRRRGGALRAMVGAVLVVFGAAGPVVSVPPQSQPAAPATSPGGAQSPPAASKEPVLPLSSDQVAAQLGRTADWYHHVVAIQPLQLAAVDSAAKDMLHQQALTAVRLALDFGRACARLLNEQARQQTASGATPSKGVSDRLDQAAADVDQRINTLQSQLDALDEQLARARGKERETLVAQKGQVSAALQLAREVHESVQDMENFETSSIAGDKGNLSPIEAQIADVERSIPELHASSGGFRAGRAGGPRGSGGASSAGGSGGGGADGGASSGGASGGGNSGTGSGNNSSAGTPNSGPSAAAANSVSSTSSPSNTLRIESAGVISLISESLSLNDMRRQVSAAIEETGQLQDTIGKLRGSLVSEVRDLVGQGLAMSTSTDPAQLLAQRAALEMDTNRFKQLSTVLVPIGEQALTVESAANTLAEWRTALGTRLGSVARYLALRIGIVLGGIAVVLVISDIWRRATFRYLHDVRRRRQFLVLRRIAMGLALALVIVFGLVSEIGSIATYIGFVTAGIAVALQNVILAIVAYFFLIGRYGVRVGDRITLSGVTGRVVEVGLMRIYLMELGGADLHATGRMVVLSNAVLFQPTALFKQIPGADYVWHTVTLTVVATADVVEAHKLLKAAADEVYDKYRSVIERQHALMQRFMDFDAASPHPEVRVRLSENGLECSVRYPVELDNAAVIDQQMLKALRDALEHDSQFKLVATGAVVLKSSES
jgi:small-conductance mechanosensitive channel